MAVLSPRKMVHFMMVCVMMVIMGRVNADDVYVIANQQPIKAISTDDIEEIFAFRAKKWGNGMPIKVFLLPKTHPATRDFVVRYMHMTPTRYFDTIAQKNGITYDVASTEYEVVMKILTTTGGIGYATGGTMMNFNDSLDVVR